TSLTPIWRIASAMACPCETRTSTCRSFATISSGLYRFLAITVLLDVKRHTSSRTTSMGADQRAVTVNPHRGPTESMGRGYTRSRDEEDSKPRTRSRDEDSKSSKASTRTSSKGDDGKPSKASTKTSSKDDDGKWSSKSGKGAKSATKAEANAN